MGKGNKTYYKLSRIDDKDGRHVYEYMYYAKITFENLLFRHQTSDYCKTLHGAFGTKCLNI